MKTQKSRIKRLFILAAYDPMGAGTVDAALMHHVRALAGHGDVIVTMDNDAPAAEQKKLRDAGAMATAATRHGEYDFGSYKRGYLYARDHDLLKNYDVVYLVNDSVYGPMFDMAPLLQRMEGLNADVFGPAFKEHRHHPHVESWFMGLRPAIFTAPWFDQFMTSITKQADKGMVILLYEDGLANLIRAHGFRADGAYHVRGRGSYNQIRHLFRRGMPFMKKMSLRRKQGALGNQIRYVLEYADAPARDAVVAGMRRVYGDAYLSWLMTRNPVRILYRHIKHFVRKVFIEGF
ncbi:hypothetical protein HDR63_03900 [bacterium]|nr:hypothetical protein [bacterium]